MNDDAWYEHAKYDEANAKTTKNMKKDQDELNATVFEGHAADDAVVVKFTGDHKMTDISIKEEAIDQMT